MQIINTSQREWNSVKAPIAFSVAYKIIRNLVPACLSSLPGLQPFCIAHSSLEHTMTSGNCAFACALTAFCRSLLAHTILPDPTPSILPSSDSSFKAQS